MSEVKQCTQCAQTIESGELFVKFKNPDPTQSPLFFHHRDRGDCYWEYLRDQVLKVQGHRRRHIRVAAYDSGVSVAA